VKLPARVGTAIAVVTTVLLTGACAEGARSGGGDAGTSVPPGATIEQYRAAFEAIEPVTIRAQSPTALGATAGRDFAAYIAAIQDWSGGKIEIEASYAGAVAPPGDVDNALADGRLDFGGVIAAYDQSEFPVAGAVATSTLLADLSIIEGSLSSNAYVSDLALNTPEFVAEFEDKGMKVLFPGSFNGSPGIYCADRRGPLSSFNGALIASGSNEWSAQLTALGATPVSMPFSEVFEGVQRGVVSCSMTGVTGATNTGIVEVAPNVVLDTSVGTTANPSVWAFSQSSWDSWPLLVRQLLWDRVDALIDGNFLKTLDGYRQLSADIKEHNGSFSGYDDAAREALRRANDEMLAGLAASSAVADPGAFVDRARQTATEWRSVPSSLGFSNSADFAGFDSWYTTTKPNTMLFAQRMYQDIFLPLRPQ
jgi:TRAP-type C4-dicarboxylate transport system substrate-binding protein